MKNPIKHFLFSMSAVFLFLLVFSGSNPLSKQQPNNSSSDNIQNRPTNKELPCRQGMITIKVKEGFGPIEAQKGPVSFGSSALDRLAEKFEINSLEKRFRHRPIPKNSSLPDLSRIYRITFPKSYSLVEVVTAFSNQQEIEYAEPVPIARLCEEPDDPYFAIQQHLSQIKASEAWDIHHGEDGTEEIVIGINDTGVEWYHSDLAQNIWQNMGEDADGDGIVFGFFYGAWMFDSGDINGIDDDGNGYIDDFIGWDFYMDDNNPDPNVGSLSIDHGTHCAGIAAGGTNNGIGIASISWNVSIFSIQIDDGEYLSWGFDGIIYAAEMGVDIISNSWGHWYYSKAEQEAISYATGLGSIIVAAAGNYTDGTFPFYPGGYTGVISVAALSGDDTKTGYSNWGKWVDISSPGGGWDGGIYSTITNGDYGYMSGTSMAAPMVAGLLGLVKSYHPDWDNDEILVQVIGSADDIDTLNPGFENQLGSGRINAFRALSETTMTGPQELRLDFISAKPNDENGDGILQQGEIVNIDLTMWNRAPASRSFNTTFTITSNDPEITLLQDVVIDTVPYDSYFTIENAFQIQIANDAAPFIAGFTLDISSDIAITYGAQAQFYLPVMAEGILVWEGQEKGDSYSGTYLSEFLTNQGIANVYSTGFPETFFGFDQVFLSCGNWGSNSGITMVSNNMSDIITEYVAEGGNIYVEAPDLFSWFQSSNMYLKGLFGLVHVTDGNTTPVSNLEGMENSLAEGFQFVETTQDQVIYIGAYETTENGQPAFIQGGDTLAVQNSGDLSQKTFCFSYSLAELVDNSVENSRFNLLYKILDFMGYEFPEGYVIANFTSDTTYGAPPLQVNFFDWSLYDDQASITSWQWDFNNDGTIDSYDQNPSWQYDEPGQYSVSLTVTTDQETNTLTSEEMIWVNEGILVYEGIENGQDYSGTFIHDYFSNNEVEVDYTTRFPSGLMGYDAVFLSFGNMGSDKTPLNKIIATQITEFLESGGKVYLEGGDCLAEGMANPAFLSLFSLASYNNGIFNQIDGLEGQPDAITHDLYFSASDQSANESIDKMVPNANGQAAFDESDYFYVASQGEGDFGQKTFCFSYSLANLVDGSQGTREELLNRITNFFNLTVSVEDKFSPKFQDLGLSVFPNPLTGNTVISYQLNQSGFVSLDVFNMDGTHKTNLISETQKSGTQKVGFKGAGLPAGVYLCVLKTNIGTYTTKMIKL